MEAKEKWAKGKWAKGKWTIAFFVAAALHGGALAAFTMQPAAMELPTDEIVVNLGLLGAIGSPAPDLPAAPEPKQPVKNKITPKPQPKPITKPIVKPVAKHIPKALPPKIERVKPLPVQIMQAPSSFVIHMAHTADVPITTPRPQPKQMPVAVPQQVRSVAPSATRAGTGNTQLPAGMSTSSGIGASGPEQLYYAKLAARMKRYKRYPASARKNKEEGTVVLQFTVLRNGRIIRSKVIQSSGQKSLDSASLRILKRVQPLPSFPPEMKQKSVTLTYPFQFRLMQ
ncbi:MAG: hypothetical protein COA43_05400 [Robiginitomaculum sp.]|nr:MAG: hypothetical protein COA43_05400 [Robiginitomaculum sp.]